MQKDGQHELVWLQNKFFIDGAVKMLRSIKVVWYWGIFVESHIVQTARFKEMAVAVMACQRIISILL